MNGRKYGHNYAPKTHGFNLRSRAFPVSYYAPRRPYRLREAMWDTLVGRFKRPRVACSTPEELCSHDGRVRPISWGRTLGWWSPPRTGETP